MSKKIIAVLIVSAILALAVTACGKIDAENTETIKTADTTTENDSVDKEIPDNSRIDEFYKKWTSMEYNIDDVLNPFAEEPEITETFLTNLYIVENEYRELMQYVDTLSVAEYRSTEKNGVSIQNEVEHGWVREPVMEVNSNETHYATGWRYLDGSIQIEPEFYVLVSWTENLKTDSVSNDFDVSRTYDVVDTSKDAYLLMLGETGYQLIRIVSDVTEK